MDEKVTRFTIFVVLNKLNTQKKKKKQFIWIFMAARMAYC